SCDRETAKRNLGKLLGNSSMFSGQQPEAIYSYTDEYGRVLFQKVRYPGKRFVIRRPDGEKWETNLNGTRKVLYHLDELLVANEVFVCEGEKDADNVRALRLGDRTAGYFVAATTNFDGAGKWRDQYSLYFAGKRVVIFADNDEIGRQHAEKIAQSVSKHA